MFVNKYKIGISLPQLSHYVFYIRITLYAVKIMLIYGKNNTNNRKTTADKHINRI